MVQTNFKTANQLLREGKLDDAVAAYREAIALNPDFSHAHHNLGEALVKVGQIEEAIAAFGQAVAINPQASWSLYNLGVLLQRQGQFQEAVGYYRRAVEQKTDVPEFYLGLGAVLVKLGQWSEAEQCLDKVVNMLYANVVRLNGTSLQTEAYYYLGAAKSGQQQWSEAVEFYRQSWEMSPGGVERCLGLAEALGKLGQWSEAVEFYRQAVVLSGESGEVLFGLGQALGQLGRWEEAIVEYGRSINLGFAGAEVRHHLGYALGQLGRWEEAVVEYRLVVEVNPKSAQVRHQLGYGLMQLERWREAEVELRRAVELHPRSAVVWQQLGDVLRELGKRDEAESAYRQALELKSGTSGYASDLSRNLPQMRGVTPTSLTREKTGKINDRGKKDGILKSQNKRSTYLNALFVLYGNIDSNGGYHAQLHATRLLEQGVDCLFAVPDSSDNEDVLRRSLHNLSNPVRILAYSDFSIPGLRLPFANGGGPDVIHAWTPREVVRKCVEKLLKQYSCPLVIHLEDNEEYLTAAKVGRPFAELSKLPEAELNRIIPGDRYHPIKGKAFLNRAQGLTMIIETLKGFNIGNVPELVLAPPVDESLFYPRPINQELRRSLGILEGHVVLAYTGNVHSGNRDEVGELYQAVEILNQQGCPTVLLRSGLNGEGMEVESWGGSYEKYLGWVEREQVPEILAAADVLVQPGVPGEFNDRRIPSKLLEYFAMGRPVVLPKSNLGLRVSHGREGYVLARYDAKGIAGAVQEIKTDRELARRLSDGAVDFYLSQLEQGLMGTKLNDFYGRLTGNVSSLGDWKRLGTTFFVVTPCLNAVATIDETIKSVIGQSGDFLIRYHVQDGGSMDGTVERLRYWEGVLSEGSSDVQCQGVEFSWASEPDWGIYDGVMRGFDSFEITPRELMTWINADDALIPGALSAICRIVREHPEVEWIGGPQYVFETDVRQKVLQRGTPTPTAVIREGLCDGKHWEMLQQEGTFFSKALWLKSKHGLKGFELAGDWNLWREMAHHGVYYQYESPLGAFRRRAGQLSVERIGDYRSEIERVVPLEVRKGRFEELYRKQEWGANLIKSDMSGRMVVEVELVREVYEKVRARKESNKVEKAEVGSNLNLVQGNDRAKYHQIVLFTPYFKAKQSDRQDELIYCLRKNIECTEIEKIVLLIDDDHRPELASSKIEIVNLSSRPTYLDWIELTEKKCADKISILANSDIYFDESISRLRELFYTNPKAFVTISRYEQKGSEQILHQNPHWSQDVWAIFGNSKLEDTLKESLKIRLGVPRCDNKVAYLFAIHGTKLYNPCYEVKTVHVQQTDSRTYDKKNDKSILGGVTYVHPSSELLKRSKLDLELWAVDFSQIKEVKFNKSLETSAKESRKSIDNKNSGVIGYDASWQYPAITEQYAYKMAKKYLQGYDQSIAYFGFPWATLIDLLLNKPEDTKQLLSVLEKYKSYLSKFTKVVTVCQHIRMLKFQYLFNEVGITDVFWSHAVKGQSTFPDYSHIKIYPFPLFPVQASEVFPQELRGVFRKFLFSFVGSKALSYYLTDSRNQIIKYLSDDKRGFIRSRESWHYQDIVYENQIKKAVTDEKNLIDESQTREFKEILKQSVFSLCPSGSGPNSIRLWESIAYGSIPVVLSDTYLPPGDLDLWESAVVVCPERADEIQTLPDCLEVLSKDKKLMKHKKEVLQVLWNRYGVECFIYDIINFFDENSRVI
ncbi:tetratricopeptide repeat protein [Okeania sp. SIO1F9]|uniref:tetratricopeptide repeat protein n=1 Tax=Okeania sp. SIO1F9 TaxID=2607813 RepID=UPI00144C3EB8|nr:tetratricopeptide repeat protein [Okeania sp. SIO1F9]NET76672.1 tetratricopeptide repeat protein [Okeania sp. SIO1F9]